MLSFSGWFRIEYKITFRYCIQFKITLYSASVGLLRREEMMIISCRIKWKALYSKQWQNQEHKTNVTHVWHHVPEWTTLIGTFSRVYFVNETTSVCIESSLDVDVYGIDLRCVSKGLRFVAKRLVSNLCTLKVPTTLGWALVGCVPICKCTIETFNDAAQQKSM